MSDEYTIACYYFPNYHVDTRNEAVHGKGWTEWELVKKARSRFEGHEQPKVPLWGYSDEADPQAMAQKIDAAADHGIDAFIFDWYWYDDGPFLQRALEEGFLHAPNNERLKFAIMWANHDWVDIHPAAADGEPALLYPGKVTPATFDRMTDHIIEKYFMHPSYWKIGGCPYFSVYELFRLVESFGSIEKTRDALRRFADKTRAAGFAGLHLNAVVWGIQILPNEKQFDDPVKMVDYLGFDSTTSYVWVHHYPLSMFPATPYERVMKQMIAVWAELQHRYSQPYHPNVTVGWDPSPRTDPNAEFTNSGYPYMATMSGNTPELFERALRNAKVFLDRETHCERILTINCWNEWTEGSYLEPDTKHGMRYLDAVKNVFGEV